MHPLSLLLVFMSIARLHCLENTTPLDEDATDLWDNGTTEGPTQKPRPKQCTWTNVRDIAFDIKANRDYILLALGLFGNALSLFVNARKMFRSSPNYYMTVLALADTATILAFSVPHLHRANTKHLPWGQAGCKISMFMQSFTRSFAVNVLVVMTIERSLIVVFPLRLQTKVSVRNAAIALGVVALLFFCLSAPLFSWSLEGFAYQQWQCGRDLPQWWRTADVVFTVFLPMVILLLCNLVIVFRMKVVADKQEELTNDSSKKSRARKQFMQITIQTLTVSFSFIMLTMLLAVLSVPTSPVLWPNRPDWARGAPGSPGYCWYAEFTFLYYEVAHLLYVLNHAVNGYLYCLFSRMFRQELATNCARVFCPGRLEKRKKQRALNSGGTAMTSMSSSKQSVSTVS